jgi:hypothetical protein
MHEVDVDAVDERRELVETVQAPFVRAPVVLVAPVDRRSASFTVAESRNT